MIGKLISAGIGSKIAAQTPGVSQGTGAMLGVIAAAAVRRMGPLGLAASAAGVWLFARHVESRKQLRAKTGGKKARPRKARSAARPVPSPTAG